MSQEEGKRRKENEEAGKTSPLGGTPDALCKVTLLRCIILVHF